MAKKTKRNRLKRFRGYSQEHKARILDSIGLDLPEFRGYSRGRKKTVLNRALDENRAQQTPGYFQEGLTGRQGLDLANRMADLRYGEPLRQVRQDQANVEPWFDRYRQQVQQAGQTFTGQMTPVIQQAQQTAQAAGQNTLPQGVDPTSEQGTDAALAAASRKALGDAFASLLTAQTGAQQGYFASQAGPVSGSAELGLKSQLAGERRGLRRERDAYKASEVGNIRENERRYGLEQAAFGLDQAEAVADVQDKARDDRRARKQEKRERREKGREVNKYGYPEAQWKRFSTSHRQRIIDKFDGKSSEGGGGDFTPLQVRETKKEIRRATALIQGKLKGKKSAPASFWSQAYSALLSEKDMDPAIARAAIQLVRFGKVRPGVANTLKSDYGVTSLPRGAKRKKPDPYELPDRPPSGGEPGGRPGFG